MDYHATPTWCPVSAIHTHDTKRDGHCRWCGYKADMTIPLPNGPYAPSELDIAYDRNWNPDYTGDDRVPRNREY